MAAATCWDIPSGKLTVCYGKSPFFIGKSTIDGPFSIAMLVYRRVTPVIMGKYVHLPSGYD